MCTEITNPGPWDHWPASGHIVDAEGNTVCTIAPDCSAQAIKVIAKAPEAIQTLSNLLTKFMGFVIQDNLASEIEVSNLVDEIKLAADFMQQFKTEMP